MTTTKEVRVTYGDVVLNASVPSLVAYTTTPTSHNVSIGGVSEVSVNAEGVHVNVVVSGAISKPLDSDLWLPHTYFIGIHESVVLNRQWSTEIEGSTVYETIGRTLGREFNDVVTVSELFDFWEGLVSFPQSTFQLTEFTSVDFSKSLLEYISANESQSIAVSKPFEFVLSPIELQAISLEKPSGDATDVVETLSKQFNLAASDFVQITELANTAVAKHLSETVQYTETYITDVTYLLGLSDTGNVEETFTRVVNYVRQPVYVVSGSEHFRFTVSSVNVSNVSALDSVSVVGDFVKYDNTVVYEFPSLHLAKRSEDAALVQESRVSTVNKNLVETVSGLELVDKNVSTIRGTLSLLYDTLNATLQRPLHSVGNVYETLLPVMAFNLKPLELLTASEDFQRSWTAARTLLDSTSVTESLQKVTSALKADLVSVYETLQAVSFRPFYGNINVFENIHLFLQLNRTLEELVSLSEALVTSLDMYRATNDNSVLHETLNRFLLRQLSESNNVFEIISLHPDSSRQDVVTAIESIQVAKASLLNELINVYENFVIYTPYVSIGHVSDDYAGTPILEV